MDNAEKIINRMMLLAKVTSIPELSRRWKVPQSTIYNWKDKGSINLETVSSNLKGVNLHWLLTGEGEQSSKVRSNDEEALLLAGRHLLNAMRALQNIQLQPEK